MSSDSLSRPRRILFVCAANVDRSRTAEHLYRDAPGLEVRSAGLMAGARVPLSEEHLRWADLVVFMEPAQELAIRARHPEIEAELLCIDVPDRYRFMSPELVAILSHRLLPHLGPPRSSDPPSASPRP